MGHRRTYNWMLWLGGLLSVVVLVGSVTGWLRFGTSLEVAATITGIVCVVLAIRENIWNFPVGIVSNICMAIVNLESHLYGLLGLQVFFMFLGLHGWYHWKRGTNKAPLRISRVNAKESVALALVAVPLILALAWYFKRIEDPEALWGAVVLVSSLIAQYLLNLKRAESWALGVGIDVINIAIYISQELYVAAGLFAFYLVMCAIAYCEWLAIYREQQTTL